MKPRSPGPSATWFSGMAGRSRARTIGSRPGFRTMRPLDGPTSTNTSFGDATRDGRHVSWNKPLGMIAERRLLFPRRPSHLGSPVLASQDFCSGSPAGRSGSPRLSSPPATMQKPAEPGDGRLPVVGSTGSEKANSGSHVELCLEAHARIGGSRPGSSFPRNAGSWFRERRVSRRDEGRSSTTEGFRVLMTFEKSAFSVRGSDGTSAREQISLFAVPRNSSVSSNALGYSRPAVRLKWALARLVSARTVAAGTPLTVSRMKAPAASMASAASGRNDQNR